MVKMQYITTTNFKHLTVFAANYDCNAYGAGTYNNTTCATGQPINPGGSLSDTGYNIILPVALAVALILAAIALLVKRIRRRKQSQQ